MSQNDVVDGAEAILISRLALALQSTDLACSLVLLTVGSATDAAWAYKLGRCVAFRARGGVPRASLGSTTSSSPAPLLRVAIVDPPAWVHSWPPIAVAVADGDLSLATAEELASERGPTISVRRGSLGTSSLGTDYTVDLAAGDCNAASTSVICHVDPVAGTAIAIHSKSVFPQEVRSAFDRVLSTAFGPGDVKTLDLLTPRASQGFAGKLVITPQDDPGAAAASVRPGDVRVWTEPAPSGSVSLALCLLRLSPGMLENLLPLLQTKVAYLRNSGGDLSEECTEVG